MMRTPHARRPHGVAPWLATGHLAPVMGQEAVSESARRAIVVLGCAARLDAGGRLAPGPLARRIAAAARAYKERASPGTIVVASGGRRWGGVVEADVMARELGHRGVPACAIVRERSSLSTRDNARFTAAVLARRAMSAADVVTCPWHLPRAMALFSLAGVEATPVAAEPDFRPGVASRIWRWGREGVLSWLDGAGAAAGARMGDSGS